MAVEARPYNKSLQMAFITGQDTEGKNILSRRTLSNIKIDALDQDMYDVAVALKSLTDNGLNSITVVERTDLVDVG